MSFSLHPTPSKWHDKGTVSVISSDPSCKDSDAWFTGRRWTPTFECGGGEDFTADFTFVHDHFFKNFQLN